MANQEKLIKEIKSLSDSIRRKNRALRMGISERDRFLETTFKPVVDPLKEMSQKLDIIKQGDIILPFYKSDVKTEKEVETGGEELTTDNSEEEEEGEEDGKEEKELDRSQISEEEEEDEPGGPNLSDISRLSSEIQYKGKLGKKYVLKMLQSIIPNRKYHIYGARLETDGLHIGNSKLDVDEKDNITINGKKYEGTVGLFELLFKDTPTAYSKDDLGKFREICVNTSCHKKKYDQSSTIHRNSSSKYKLIISQLFPSRLEEIRRKYPSSGDLSSPRLTARKTRAKVASTSGSGLLKNTYSTNIIYYNNLNKLVDRMRLIHEAMKAGHTGLQNEWVALVDELLKRGIIIK